MRHVLMAGVACAVLGGASPAAAQIFGFDPQGVYVAGDVGYHTQEGIEGESNVNAADGAPYRLDFSSEDDIAGFARLGYRVSPNWRVELEYGYRRGDMEGVRGPGRAAGIPSALCRPGVLRTAASPTCGDPEGALRAGSLMGNVIYDFFSPESRLRPFVGVGVGAVEVHNKVFGQLSAVGPGAAPFQNASFDDMDTGFAYQGIIGVAYAINDRLSLDLTGRYLAADGLEFGSVTTNATQPPRGNVTNLGIFEGDYRDASVSLGLRYQFGAPSAPPPPPLPPEPAPMPAPMPTPPPPPPVTEPPAPVRPVSQEFVVYFPFDQSVLTTEAQNVIQQAAQYAQSGQPTSIVITGHADTSGSAAYNVRLSERRAKAVADALTGMGVQQSAMSVDWRGESQPAVPTPDGTKEPLNRRTTIGINF